MLDILFITPPTPSPLASIALRNMSIKPSLGFGYMEALLNQNNFSTETLNLSFGIENIEFFKNLILKKKPKIIAFSAMTETYNNALRLADICKKINIQTIIIIGGPHVTFLDKEALIGTNIDIVVRNEGELTMIDLAKCLVNGNGMIKNIKGITYKENNKITRNPPRPLIRNLDRLPFPKREAAIKYDINKSCAGIITSRGCPGKCIFCSAGAMSGGKYRKRSPENVFEEVKYMTKLGYSSFFFQDDTISADISRLIKICDLIENLNIKWVAESRVDVISNDKDIINRMAKAGCTSVQFGVESGSDNILNTIKKGISINQVEKAVKFTRENDVEAVCSFMMGHPNDTIDTIEQSISFGEKLQKNYGVGVLFSLTTPYPGTELYKHPQKFKIKISTYNFDKYTLFNPIFDTEKLTKEQLRNFHFDSMCRISKSTPEKWRKKWTHLSTNNLTGEV